MPLLSFKCPECGKVFDELVKSSDDSPKCPQCGAVAKRSFSGKCYGIVGGTPAGCTHNCATCKGCDK